MSKSSLLYSITIFLFCLATNLQSQSANTYHHYTTKDGLPSNYVYGAMQDRNGYIWFYTEKGVSKFDGYTFKNFQEELPNYDVWGLSEDSKGRIWVHSIHNQIVYIAEDSIHTIKTPDNIRFHINAFNETNDTIWFYTETSFDGGKKRNANFYIQDDTIINKPRDLSNVQLTIPITKNEIRIITQTIDQYVYIKNDSLFRFDYSGTLQDKKAFRNDKLKENYHKFSQIKTVNYRKTRGPLSFYCGNNNTGITKWDDEKELFQTILYDEIYDYPVSPSYIPGYLTENSFQVTLMPAPGFLEVDLDLNVIDTFSISGVNYRRIFKDRQGNFWIATDDDGVYFISADARNTISYNFENDNNITCIAGNNKGQIFMGTIKGGLYSLNNKQKFNPLISSNQLGNNLRGLSLTKDGKLYAGADLGHYEISVNDPISQSSTKSFLDFKFKKPTSTKYNKIDQQGNFNAYIKANAYDEKNKTLWLSNGNDVGYVDFSDPLILKSDLIRLDAINKIAIGQDGEIWAAGSGGVWRIKDLEIQGMQKIHDLFKKNVKDIVVDQNNILWVATDRNGIFGFRNDLLYAIPASKENMANDLYFDQQNFLWAGTDSGIQQYKIDPENFNQQKQVRTYNTNDGLLSNEINAIFVSDEFIYAGTSKGLSKINRTGKYGDDSPPNIKIQNIRINGVPKKTIPKYVLGYKEKAIEIDFVALSYKSLGAIQYQYQLEGADEEWQETKNTTLRYASLSPGKYTFRLRAKDIENRESELVHPLVFEISPPFWKRLWFRILAIIIVAGITWLIYKRSINAIKKDEAEKTRIAQKIAELELKALQAQMNPHFVFNALTSIRYQIQNNQPNEAGDYLARFAKLMRLFLESSKNNMASLDEEIRLITLYVEMEQLRFEKLFEFELTVHKNINKFMMKIPTLLLQPFVENSINHGLFHKEEKGVLKIDFQLAGDELIICTIEDNGIGREAAAIINKRSTKGHKSRGMQIVGERLETLKQKDGLDVHIEFIDLKEFDGTNSGTKVVLQIPLLD